MYHCLFMLDRSHNYSSRLHYAGDRHLPVDVVPIYPHQYYSEYRDSNYNVFNGTHRRSSFWKTFDESRTPTATGYTGDGDPPPIPHLCSQLDEEAFLLIDAVVRASEDPLSQLMYMFNCDRYMASRIMLDATRHAQYDRFLSFHSLERCDRRERSFEGQWKRRLQSQYVEKALEGIIQELEEDKRYREKDKSSSLLGLEGVSKRKNRFVDNYCYHAPHGPRPRRVFWGQRMEDIAAYLKKIKSWIQIPKRTKYIASHFPQKCNIRMLIQQHSQQRKTFLLSTWLCRPVRRRCLQKTQTGSRKFTLLLPESIRSTR